MKFLKQKRGQMIFLALMVFVIVFAAIVQLILPIQQQIVTARASDKLDCNNSSISVGTKGACVLVDLSLPYFIGVAIAGAASYFTLKKGSFG